MFIDQFHALGHTRANDGKMETEIVRLRGRTFFLRQAG